MKIYPTVQFRMASSGNKASIINSWKMNLFLFLNSNHGQKVLFFSHFKIVTYVCCTWIWTSSPEKKEQSLFLTTHDRCEINLNNEVLSSTLVVFFFQLLYTTAKRSHLKKKNSNILIWLLFFLLYCLTILLTEWYYYFSFCKNKKKERRRKSFERNI
jgi:hypothetical protein